MSVDVSGLEKVIDEVFSFSEEELHLLWKLKHNSPKYYEALLYSAGIIEQRGKKYTGASWDGSSEFANFLADARIQGVGVRAIFLQWISKKLARIQINQADYADESFLDSIRDLANYALLFLGWELKEKKHGLRRTSQQNSE